MESITTLALITSALNKTLSFFLFTFLDLLDSTLCILYKLLDYVIESEWNPRGEGGGGDILVTEDRASKILSLTPTNKLQLDDISDTLFCRPSLLSDVSSSFDVNPKRNANSTMVEILRRKTRGGPMPRWSDCHCKTCTSWSSSNSRSLYVHVEGPPEGAEEDVLFIHGFISSALFWTETVFENFGEATKARYRMFAVDLLGFGRSPKPEESLYTLREHVEMIERSVIEAYGVRSLHIVAHSLGSILALALAVKYPNVIKSLTLIAPPYFPVPEGEVKSAEYVLKKVAPRKLWPPMALGASMTCWYEHISRTVSLLFCKNHRVWKLAVRIITLNRVRTFLVDGFFCHTHRSSWHTFHNIICGGAARTDHYLDVVNQQLNCQVTVFHGRDDELIPMECSLALASRVSRAKVHVIDNKDHLTIVVGRQKAFSRELEEIWMKAAPSEKVS